MQTTQRMFSATLILIVLCLLGASCGSKGPWQAASSDKAFAKSQAPMNLLHKDLRKKIASDKAITSHTDDGRMKVAIVLRNRSKKPLNVQVRTVFRDEEGLSTGDETNWEDIWLEPRQSQTYRAESKITFAESYTVEVRKP